MTKARIKTSDWPISPFYGVKLHSFFDAAFFAVGLYAALLTAFLVLDLVQTKGTQQGALMYTLP